MVPLTIAEQKKQMRAEIRAQRDALTEQERREKSAKICEYVLKGEWFRHLRELVEGGRRYIDQAQRPATEEGRFIGGIQQSVIEEGRSTGGVQQSSTEGAQSTGGVRQSSTEGAQSTGGERRLATGLAPLLCAYMPFRSEVDITPIIEWCWAQGIGVVLPRVEPDPVEPTPVDPAVPLDAAGPSDGADRDAGQPEQAGTTNDHAAQRQPHFSLRYIEGYHQLIPGKWGIREPAPSTPQLTDLSRIGLILTPGLAFDRKGGRLGYGGGYYDAFISRFDKQGIPRPPLIAPAFHLQLVPEVPMEPHDFRVDRIITENFTNL
jgi:5-formyltetrahydrofolate cyclo-ligase